MAGEAKAQRRAAWEPPGGARDGRNVGRMTVGRLLLRLVRLGIGLVLLWCAAVFCLGLVYSAAPPVSTLMLAR